MTSFEQVRPIADAVLYEGYVLYPYRANDAKNRVRWQFGVLAPPAFAESDASERAHLRADLLLDGRPGSLQVRLRFLQVQRRTVQREVDGRMEAVSVLDAGDTAYLPFDEAVPREVDVAADVREVLGSPVSRRFGVPGGRAVEPLPGGRLVRERLPLTGTVVLRAEELPGPYGAIRLRVEARNTTVGDRRPGPSAREEALRRSLVAAHLLVRLDRGRFLSLTDPPEWAARFAGECQNDGVWPVLAGEAGARDLVLCSPIILPDHPQVAPESTTEFFDGTEMDEMLSLRALTLTEEEKRAVRGTDPRAAELLDRVDHLPPELMDRLHGAVRHLGQGGRRVPPHENGSGAVEVQGVTIREGSRVLLRPGVRRADAQDLFLAGRTATVTRVLHDLDGKDHVAVLLEDDPGQDVALVHGRYLYFAPDEVEPLGVGT